MYLVSLEGSTHQIRPNNPNMEVLFSQVGKWRPKLILFHISYILVTL